MPLLPCNLQVTDSLSRPWCVICNAGFQWDPTTSMCLVSSCAATQAGASAQQQVFTYTVSGQTRSVYYCGTSAAATSSTQVSGFPLCIVS